MSDQENWGPWVTHDGKGCPCVGDYVNSVSAGGEEFYHIAHGMLAEGDGLCVDCWVAAECLVVGKPDWAVTRYRIRKPLGLTMLEAIARDATAPIVKVDA